MRAAAKQERRGITFAEVAVCSSASIECVAPLQLPLAAAPADEPTVWDLHSKRSLLFSLSDSAAAIALPEAARSPHACRFACTFIIYCFTCIDLEVTFSTISSPSIYLNSDLIYSILLSYLSTLKIKHKIFSYFLCSIKQTYLSLFKSRKKKIDNAEITQQN